MSVGDRIVVISSYFSMFLLIPLYIFHSQSIAEKGNILTVLSMQTSRWCSLKRIIPTQLINQAIKISQLLKDRISYYKIMIFTLYEAALSATQTKHIHAGISGLIKKNRTEYIMIYKYGDLKYFCSLVKQCFVELHQHHS